nr:unnamed protein product [Naegleria fowleri]
MLQKNHHITSSSLIGKRTREDSRSIITSNPSSHHEWWRIPRVHPPNHHDGHTNHPPNHHDHFPPPLEREQDIEQEIEEFKVEHCEKALTLFRRSLSKHQATLQKYQQQDQQQQQQPFRMKNKEASSISYFSVQEQEPKQETPPSLPSARVKKENNNNNNNNNHLFVRPGTHHHHLKNTLALTVFSSDLFKLQYTHFEYLKNDEFSVDYGEYEKYFDDLSFVENQNNKAKKSEYNMFSRYYLEIMSETVYRSMADKMYDRYGDDEMVWNKMVQDFMKEYENEYGSLFLHVMNKEQESEKNLFKRERAQKTQECEGSLETMWITTAKSLCFKCMRFDCPIHMIEYKACVRDPADKRVVLKFNDKEIIERILDKLFKKQHELIESKQITLIPCCEHENKCHVYYYTQQWSSTSSMKVASYNDWTEIDKELALNSIYIYGEQIMGILNGSQTSLHKNICQQPIRDVFCQISRHHRKPCSEIAQFLKDWFYKNSLLKQHVAMTTRDNSTIPLEKLPTLRRMAPSFLSPQEQALLTIQTPKRVSDRTVICNRNQPVIYNPCQCALLNVSECTCVKNGTYCTKLCHCFTTDNMFHKVYKDMPCPGGKKCWCKIFSRTCSDQCGRKCHPYQFTKKFFKKCAVGLSQINGLGLFTLEDIETGSLIMEYVGELVSYDELNRRDILCKVFQSCYVFDLKQGLGVDAYRKGNESRFVNDADRPVKFKGAKNNCMPKVVFDSEMHDYRIGIFALEKIKDPNCCFLMATISGIPC